MERLKNLFKREINVRSESFNQSQDLVSSGSPDIKHYEEQDGNIVDDYFNEYKK